MGDFKWKQNCVKGVPSRKKIVQFSFSEKSNYVKVFRFLLLFLIFWLRIISLRCIFKTEVLIFCQVSSLNQRLEQREREFESRLRNVEEMNRQSVNELREMLNGQQKLGAQYVLSQTAFKND